MNSLWLSFGKTLLSTTKSLFTIASALEQRPGPTMKTRFTQINKIPEGNLRAKWSDMNEIQKSMSDSKEVKLQQQIDNYMNNKMSLIGRTYFKVNAQINLVTILMVFSARNALHKIAIRLSNSTISLAINRSAKLSILKENFALAAKSERGDVPGWVLVVLMTTGLVTGIWTVAQPRLSSILKNSLDNMNGIR
jgi:hypothetical protein